MSASFSPPLIVLRNESAPLPYSEQKGQRFSNFQELDLLVADACAARSLVGDGPAFSDSSPLSICAGVRQLFDWELGFSHHLDRV